MKKATYKEAMKINKRNGLDTFEDDDIRLFWAAADDESATYCFESRKERDSFVEKWNIKDE